ncbi:MAG: MCE family protein [Candidatus Omnitrophica bacterium]|nr:MCE family protein [Candidatus Omnitrophota bacterium]
MKKSDPYTPNEIRSGLMVVSCVVVLLGLLFFASKSQLFKQTYQADILFNYISGLAKNAPVHFAGHEVGKVTDIRFLGGSDNSVLVTVTISRDVVLKRDSRAFINVLGFMGEKFIEISPGTIEAQPLGKGATLRGDDPVAMMEVVKKGTEILAEFEKISVSLQNLIANMNDLLGENEEEVEDIFKNLDEASVNLKEMTADLKQKPWKLLRKG